MARILVVEDDPDSRSFLASFLELHGHTILPCVSACEAHNRLHNHCVPDLAILDINLPDEHGIQLAWELRNEHPNLPIIIASAVLNQWEEDDIYDCGADSVMEKPYDLTTLHDLMDHLIKHGRQTRDTG